MTAQPQRQTEAPAAIPPGQTSPEQVVRDSFLLAARYHAAGRLVEAEKLYRAILAFDPAHADSLHGMGVIAFAVGRHDFAESFLRQALEQRTEPTFHNNLALVLLAQGRHDEARAEVSLALALRPTYPEAYNAIGNIEQKRGHKPEAIAAYRRALALRPAYADASANLARVLLDSDRLDEAQAACADALALNPQCPEALNTLGNIFRARDAYAEAIAQFDAALAARPNYAEAFSNKAVALLMQRRIEEALVNVNCALACAPNLAAAWSVHGSALFAQGKLEAAAEKFRRAIALDSRSVEAHNNLGTTLFQLDRLDEAIESFEAAIALSDQDSQSDGHYNLGTTLIEGNHLDRAIKCLRKAVEADPQSAAALNNLGVALQNTGDPEQAVACYTRGIEVDPLYAGAYCNRLMAMHYVPRYDNADLLRVAREFGAMFDRPEPPPPPRDPAPGRRLKIGYVSGDFNNHPVGFFFQRAFAAHDRAAFELYCYYNWPTSDDMTERLRAQDCHWRDVHGDSDDEFFARIREDEIDILVDLSGHTNKTRLVLFGKKPAPVQASWIGYFGTTGLKSMDYLILDPVAAPRGADACYTEALVRLPYGRFCYAPPAFDLPAGPPPSVAGRPPTFGCFNNVAKLRPEVLDLWARILIRSPGSRLTLKWKSLDESSVREAFTKAFAARGVTADRLDLRGPSAYLDMLRQYNEIDVALDPFPFGGATTSCEALWMGVPVVSLPTDRLASRQTLGFLSQMGFADLAASGPDDYVDKAVALASDPARLADLRPKLRAALEQAPFCDGAKFTATLEAAYREMWRRHQAGEPPRPIDIAPQA